MVPARAIPTGRIGEGAAADGGSKVDDDDGVAPVVAVVMASQKAARPGSVEQAPHVLGSPVHIGSGDEF